MERLSTSINRQFLALSQDMAIFTDVDPDLGLCTRKWHLEYFTEYVARGS